MLVSGVHFCRHLTASPMHIVNNKARLEGQQKVELWQGSVHVFILFSNPMTAPKSTAKEAHDKRKRRMPPPQKCFAGARHLKFLVAPPKRVMACAAVRNFSLVPPKSQFLNFQLPRKQAPVAWFVVGDEQNGKLINRP